MFSILHEHHFISLLCTERDYFNHTSTKTTVRTVWASPGSAAILAHICAAVQSANGLDEGEYKSEGVVMNKE